MKSAIFDKQDTICMIFRLSGCGIATGSMFAIGIFTLKYAVYAERCTRDDGMKGTYCATIKDFCGLMLVVLSK